METQKDLDLICLLAAYHCMTIAVLTEAGKQGKPTEELEAESKSAYEVLVAALHRAGYLAVYPTVFPEYADIGNGVKH